MLDKIAITTVYFIGGVGQTLFRRHGSGVTRPKGGGNPSLDTKKLRGSGGRPLLQRCAFVRLLRVPDYCRLHGAKERTASFNSAGLSIGSKDSDDTDGARL